MEWKALANAIIHENFDPNLKHIYIGCEVCHNPIMKVIYQAEHILEPDNTRITFLIMECPECGHLELDCIGTYELKNTNAKEVMPFIGHYFNLWRDATDFFYPLGR